MLLNTEELLALINGDADAERLADLLARIDRCPDSAAALEVLVSLRANREEALEALRMAAEADASSPGPIPHPSSLPIRSPGWATQGLRLAASVALVAAIGVWGATSFFGGNTPTGDPTALATHTLANSINFPSMDVELTANDSRMVAEAALALDSERFDDVIRILDGQETDAAGYVPLLRGTAEYFRKNYDVAADHLSIIRSLDTADSNVKHQALWYAANAQLALDSPITASMFLEQLKSAPAGYAFRDAAAAKEDALRTVLGLNSAPHNNQQ